MKQLVLALIMMLSILGKAQAHLGSTSADIKGRYPDKTFTTGYTNDGSKYISAEMNLGTFVYYFNKENGLTDLCVQFPLFGVA